VTMRSKVHSRVLHGGLGLKFTKFNGPGQVRAEMSSDCVGPGLKVLARLPLRPVFGSLFWASSAKQKALTNLVNDSVVGVPVIMSDNFSDISEGEVVSTTQLIEELYGDNIDADLIVASQQFDIGLATDSVTDTAVKELYGEDTDADLISASQQFDIATDSVPDSAAVTMLKTPASERPFASPMAQEELDELNHSRLTKKTVDKSILEVTVIGEWRGHQNRCSLEKSHTGMVYLNKCVF